MRLFVAIELSESLRRSLAKTQSALRRDCDGVRWVDPELMHLTVKFLGDVEDSQIALIGDAVGCAAAASEQFEMVVGGCGCFPPRGTVRVVWAGVEEMSGRLASCAESVGALLEPLGFRREARAFSPHITLGRVREDRSRGAIREAVGCYQLSSTIETVDSLVLMSSVLSKQGPSYSVVSRAMLAGRG